MEPTISIHASLDQVGTDLLFDRAGYLGTIRGAGCFLWHEVEYTRTPRSCPFGSLDQILFKLGSYDGLFPSRVYHDVLAFVPFNARIESSPPEMRLPADALDLITWLRMPWGLPSVRDHGRDRIVPRKGPVMAPTPTIAFLLRCFLASHGIPRAPFQSVSIMARVDQ